MDQSNDVKPNQQAALLSGIPNANSEAKAVEQAAAATAAAKEAADKAAAEAAKNIDTNLVNEAPKEKEGEVEPTKEGEVVEYQSTGDPGLDMALELIGKASIGPEHAAMKAAAAGSFEALAALLESKDVKGHARIVALMEKSHTERTAKADAKKTADQQAILKAAGGTEAAWNELKAWMGKTATDAELAEINSTLKAGGWAARLAVEALAARFAATGASGPTPVRKDGSGGSGPSGGESLSPRAYTQAVSDLRRTYRGDFESSREYAALKARRAAWKG